MSEEDLWRQSKMQQVPFPQQMPVLWDGLWIKSCNSQPVSYFQSQNPQNSPHFELLNLKKPN